MDPVEPLGRRENIDVLSVSDVAVEPEGKRPDERERNGLLRQAAAQRFENGRDVAGVHVVSSELLDQRTVNSSSHNQIIGLSDGGPKAASPPPGTEAFGPA